MGLGFGDYANSRLPGGLADADLDELARLARAGAVDGLDWAYPDWRDSCDRGSVHGHKRVHRRMRREFSDQTRNVRHRIRSGSERVTRYRAHTRARERVRSRERHTNRSVEPDQRIESTFVPAKRYYR